MADAREGGTAVPGTALADRAEIGTVEFVEAGAAEPEGLAGIGAGEFLDAGAGEHTAYKWSGMTSVKLAGVFI